MGSLARAFAHRGIAIVACGAIGCALDAQGAAPPGDDLFEAGVAPRVDAAQPAMLGITQDAGDDVAVNESAGVDAATSTDDSAVAPVDAGPSAMDGGGGCDQDGDGHKAMGPTCAGDDCCDIDANARPGQTLYYSSADGCGSFDYDCNGKVDEQYAAVSCSLGFFTCSGDGFATPVPACGATGTYDSCNFGVFTCNQQGAARVQGCH